eukprot:11219603-Lingulodinium_polyedra.AAC.1
MLPSVTLRYATLHYNTLRCVALRYALHVAPYAVRVAQRYATLHYATQHYTLRPTHYVLYYTAIRHATLRNATLRYRIRL